jgi:hypothetical protein
LRYAIREAANSHMRISRQRSVLKAWGLKLAKRVGNKKALVAVARKLAINVHRMWVKRLHKNALVALPALPRTWVRSVRFDRSATLRATQISARAASLDDLSLAEPHHGAATDRLRTEARARQSRRAVEVCCVSRGVCARRVGQSGFIPVKAIRPVTRSQL